MKDKVEQELKIFRKFLETRSISLDEVTFESRKPKEPDILLHYSNGSNIAFELVELLDVNYGRMRGILLDTVGAIRAFVENLTSDKKDCLYRKYGNAFLYFKFIQGATFKQRKDILPKIFDKLLVLKDDFTGETLENDPECSHALNSISISRGNFVGPIFDPDSVGCIGDPTIDVIKRKFIKTYETKSPIELLAYIDVNPMMPDSIWIDNLRKFLEAYPKPLPFEKIWVFDYRKHKIKFEY
jgi:hypothetical protein